MVTKIVHLSEEEYITIKNGIDVLMIIIELSEMGEYEEITMSRISSLLWDKRWLVEELKDEFPFEGSREDLLWWLKETSKMREKHGQQD
jgi:hypothetical protein